MAMNLIAAAFAAAAVAADSGPPALSVSADTPSVPLAPVRAERRFVDLPTLEYSFEIEARCNDGWIAESLSLSVADSRVTFGPGQLAAEAHRTVVLRIPARQLAPVAVHGFCSADAASSPAAGAAPARVADPGPLTLRAVLSAQGSLRCRTDTEARVDWVSRPLDVTLVCGEPAPAGRTTGAP